MSERRKIRLEVVTPERVEFSRDVDSIMAPAYDGYIGILPGHIPLVTRLNVGVLRIGIDGEYTNMAVSEGYMEVTPSKVVVLAEAAELPEEIDVERALEAKRKAEELLANGIERISVIQAQIALEKAINRLKVAKYKNGAAHRRVPSDAKVE